jgi:type IV pilus biogenesis protein CpaD/CtpE
LMRILLLGLCLGLAGCARVPSVAPEAVPISVAVSRPVERDVTDYADFTGPMAAALDQKLDVAATATR